MRSYAIVGAGAVGGFYGAKLAKSGFDVHFLYNSEFETVRREGLRVLSPDGDITLAVNCYSSAQDMPKVDVVLVALKAAQTPLLADILPYLLKESSLVLCLQNGLGNEDAIAMMNGVGEGRVIAGAAFICSERGESGVVHHYSEGRLSIGPYFPDPAQSLVESIAGIAQDFATSQVACKVRSNGREVKWGKLVWNIPYSGGSLYYGAVPVDRIAGVPEREEFVKALMKEILAAAESDGAKIDERLPMQNLEATRKMGAYKPSILVDFEKGRPMEVDCIFREPLRRGQRAGHEMSQLKELVRGIESLMKKTISSEG
jgi:2-dehydropantoate 2-reductase